MKDPEEFARRWADAWNRRAVEEVLAHFTDDTVFTSPTARKVVGNTVVRGKEALRAYWVKALTQVKAIEFMVERVVWDEARREIAIVYLATIDGVSTPVSENFRFDAAGKIRAADVFHGAPSTTPGP